MKLFDQTRETKSLFDTRVNKIINALNYIIPRQMEKIEKLEAEQKDSKLI